MTSSIVEHSVDLSFHGVQYTINVLTDDGKRLIIELEQPADEQFWSGEFSAQYVEDITRKTGSFKRFDVMVKMIISALLHESASVFLDLLTYSDLELLRQKKSTKASDSSVSSISSLKSQNKRYLILTYASEFDRVHYPFPLAHHPAPPAATLQRTITRLRNELKHLQQSTAPGSSEARRELQALERDNRILAKERDDLRAQLQDTAARYGKDPLQGQAELLADLEREVAARTEAEDSLRRTQRQLQDLTDQFVTLEAGLEDVGGAMGLTQILQDHDRLVAENRSLRTRCRDMSRQLVSRRRPATMGGAQHPSRGTAGHRARGAGSRVGSSRSSVRSKSSVRRSTASRVSSRASGPVRSDSEQSDSSAASSRRRAGVGAHRRPRGLRGVPSVADRTTAASRARTAAVARSRSRSQSSSRWSRSTHDTASSGSDTDATGQSTGHRSGRRRRMVRSPRGGGSSPGPAAFDPTAYEQDRKRKLAEAARRNRSRQLMLIHGTDRAGRPRQAAGQSSSSARRRRSAPRRSRDRDRTGDGAVASRTPSPAPRDSHAPPGSADSRQSRRSAHGSGKHQLASQPPRAPHSPGGVAHRVNRQRHTVRDSTDTHASRGQPSKVRSVSPADHTASDLTAHAQAGAPSRPATSTRRAVRHVRPPVVPAPRNASASSEPVQTAQQLPVPPPVTRKPFVASDTVRGSESKPPAGPRTRTRAQGGQRATLAMSSAGGRAGHADTTTQGRRAGGVSRDTEQAMLSSSTAGKDGESKEDFDATQEISSIDKRLQDLQEFLRKAKAGLPLSFPGGTAESGGDR